MIPEISVVVPVHDEQGAAGPLAREIAAGRITGALATSNARALAA